MRAGRPDKDGLVWEGNYDWIDFLHCFVLQESRRIRLKLTHGNDEGPALDTLTVVPVMDMINYAGEASNVYYEMVDFGDALAVKATREIQQGEEILLAIKDASLSSGQSALDNLDVAYRFGMTLGDNPTRAEQLDKDVCEGLMSAIEELHARKDKKHLVRMLFSELVYESCQEASEPPAHKSPQTASLPLGRGQG